MSRIVNLLDQPRARDGRYATKIPCDACGKPVTGEHCTDDAVCDGGDGPGFYLCSRKRCNDRIPDGLEERRAYYTAQRALNDAAARARR
jgi:hypothetical protein